MTLQTTSTSSSTNLMLSLYKPLTHTSVPLDLSDINSDLVKEHAIHNKLQLKINELRINSYDYNYVDLDYSLLFGQSPFIFVMVGLPALGKSTISKQLKEFFNRFDNLKSKIYNAGLTRRKNQENNDASFFDSNNIEGNILRERYVDITINNLIDDILTNKINIGFLDATNSTASRRKRMIDVIIDKVPNPTIILMNVVNNNPLKNDFNIACKTKNMDYLLKNYYDSIRDFKIRTSHYMQIYEPITTKELINYPISLYILFEDGGDIFDINRFDNLNFNFLSILDHFIKNYKVNFGDVYEKRVNDWSEFVEKLQSDDEELLRKNLKVELQDES